MECTLVDSEDLCLNRGISPLKVQLRVGYFNAFLAQEGDNIRTSISSEVQNYIWRTAQGGEVENSNF